jgi:hypothetical protein
VAVLLPSAELQFCDANGHPYAGGTLELWVPGTTTPKDSWQDQAGTVLNTNPIVLDSAGRCVIWGDGDYRTVLSDANGILIWDQVSSTSISAAMAPVVDAPTIAEAVRLLGIQSLIDAEATARQNADNALQAEINGLATTAALNAEIARAEAAEAALQIALNNEIARAEAAEAALQSAIDGITGAGTAGLRDGSATTDATGRFNATWSSAFPTRTTGLKAWFYGTALPVWPDPRTDNLYNLYFLDVSGNPITADVSGVYGAQCQTVDTDGTTHIVASTTISWEATGI